MFGLKGFIGFRVQVVSRQLAALAATKLSKEEVGLADELLRSYKHSGESPVRSLIMLYNHREVLEKELQSVFMKAVPSEKLAGPARLSRARELLQQNADPNAGDEFGSTSLMYAAYEGDLGWFGPCWMPEPSWRSAMR